MKDNETNRFLQNKDMAMPMQDGPNLGPGPDLTKMMQQRNNGTSEEEIGEVKEVDKGIDNPENT